MVLDDILRDTLSRIEEGMPTDPTPGPVFWSLVGEVYPQMVDGMFESSLITGVVQANNISVTLAPNRTYYDLQGPSAVVAKGMVAALRMKAPYAIRKTSLKALDDMVPGWQQAAPSTHIQCWGPLGVSGFFIYPTLIAQNTVTMDFIASPVNQPRPYSGTIPIPLQTEFCDLVSEYAAALLRAKEGGQEAEEAATVYQEYLSVVKELSLFQSRIDSLVLSAAYGGKVTVNPRTQV